MKYLAFVGYVALVLLLVRERRGNRAALVTLSWILFVFPAGAAGAFTVLFVWTKAFGISLAAYHQIHFVIQLVSFCIFLFAGMFGGAIAGGWLWSRIAYHIFHFNKADFELFFVNPSSSSAITRWNKRAIEHLFRKQ